MLGPLRFTGIYPTWLVVTAAIVAAALVAWYYLRETSSLEAPYSFLLPALRGTAVALVILILAGPVWHRREIVGSLGKVVFAVDASQSMSISDSGQEGSSPERVRRALELLTGNASREGWLESLHETHDVTVLSFSSGDPAILWSSEGEEPDTVPGTLDLAADGKRSDLSSPLSGVLGAMLGSSELLEEPDPEMPLRRAALVMLSDGRDNARRAPDDEGRTAVDLAKQLELSGAVVHAVGMGSEDEPADVGVIDVVRPDSVAADGRLAGQVVLKQFGATGQPLQLRIESAGETVWTKTVSADGNPQQVVPFEIDVQPIVDNMAVDGPRGVKRSTRVMDLRAAVEPVLGDYSDENNAMPFRVAASMRDRRLLILDGSSRWETRYIRNLFERDPAWEVDTILCGPGTEMPTLVRGEERGQFPDSREAMARYDAIILGQVPGDQLSESDTFHLREFVMRGGGMVVIDGRFGTLRTLAEDGLAELIPVEYLPGTPQILVENFGPTSLGLEHPVMNLIGDTEQLFDFWTKLPAPRTVARVRRLPGAEVWADVVEKNTGQLQDAESESDALVRKSPWLVTRLAGAGRVFYVAGEETWRWRYKVADRFHARFWNQILAAVMQPPYAASDEYAALGTDKIEYMAGESSTIRVRLQNAAGDPVADSMVDALLISEDRVIGTVPLTLDDPARGKYQGQTPPLAAGQYTIRVRASGFDQAALQASTPIWVGERASEEMRRVSLNKDALLQITDAGKGIYVHESSADDLLEEIRPLSSGSIVESDILIWQSYYWFLAVLALLAVEWWLRKRAGLV